MKLDPNPPQLKNGLYRHNKTGHIYEVLGVALQTETGEYFVIYRPLVPDETKEYSYELFARPYGMFVENVNLDGKIVPRFEFQAGNL
jgi:hypothetical protein